MIFTTRENSFPESEEFLGSVWKSQWKIISENNIYGFSSRHMFSTIHICSHVCILVHMILFYSHCFAMFFFCLHLFTGVHTTTHRMDYSETRRLSRSVSRAFSSTFNLVRYLGLLTLKKKCEQGFLFLKYFLFLCRSI